MNQRSAPCPLQMHPMEQSSTQVQPFKVAEHVTQVPCIGSMHPASLNIIEPPGLMYSENPNAATLHRGPYTSSFQNYHVVPNLIMPPPPNYYGPYMFSPNNSYPTQTHELGINNHQYYDNTNEFGKIMSDSSSQSSAILSSSSGLLPIQPVRQVRENIQMMDGSRRTLMNQSSAVPPPQAVPHFNYMMQVNHTDQPMHPHALTNGWIAQFGSESSIGSRSCSYWNCTPVPYLNGGLELANMGIQAFPAGSSSGSSAPLIYDPSSLPNFHQAQNYGHHIQMQPNMYQPPFSMAHNPNGYPVTADQIYQPQVIPHVVPGFIHSGVRILSQEDAAMMDMPRFYAVENQIDRHQDMRLDIDEMSYEELLALEERIGYVKTGLTEEYITKALQKSVRGAFSQGTEACIICQVDYEEDEVVGTLDCGHKYHGECIKQWLLVKNLCPICKKTGLGTNAVEK